MLEDASEWQTFVTELEYEGSGRLDFRRYNLDLAPDVMDELGVPIPPGIDVTDIGLDAVDAIDFLVDIGRAFGRRIDFDNPDGLFLRSELGGKPPQF